MNAVPDRQDEDAPLHPAANSGLVGHEGAERSFLDAFESGRLAHAWLITGPRGIGKATLAYRFARHILAQGNEEAGGLFGDALPVDKDGGGLYLAPDHPVFMRIAAGGYADLRVVTRTINEKTGKLRTEIIVEDVRSIADFMSLTPAEGGWRVVIIDCADEMNRHAANAVLKVLEEPPKKALLLLISHNPGRLLATIRSRCLKMPLSPLPEDTVVRLLLEHHPDMTPEDATDLALLAEGSIGRALELEAEGGVELYRELTGLLDRLPDLDIGAMHDLSGRLGKAGADSAFHTFGDLLRSWLGRRIVELSKTSNASNLDRWLEVWEKINHLLDRTDAVNLDRRQTVVGIFLALQGAAKP